MKKYTQFRVGTDPFNPELVSGLLWQFDLDGINETDNSLLLFADASKGISIDNIRGLLGKMVAEGLILSFTIDQETLEDKNWNEEYEKNVRVIEVSDRVVIKPSFKNYDAKQGQTIITIDPKMSFGTGEHATTKLVLRLIEKHVKAGDKVLDVGSGTGVLGICAVMLGASSSLGIDNDEWCLLNGTENIKANNLEQKAEVRQAEITEIEESSFDLIVANINKRILLDIAPNLREKLVPSGKLILSGLLQTDKEDILEKYASLNLELIENLNMDEWCALVLV